MVLRIRGWIPPPASFPLVSVMFCIVLALKFYKCNKCVQSAYRSREDPWISTDCDNESDISYNLACEDQNAHEVPETIIEYISL